MPIRRGKKTGSKMPRRARGYRRRARVPRGINSSYNAPKNFCETIYFKDLVSNPGLAVGDGTAYSMTLTPNNLPNLNGRLADLYRQFCIRGIKIMYQPAYNNFPATSGVAIAPRVYFAEDKTADITDGSSIDVTRLMTQDNVKVYNAFRSWSTYVKFPKPLTLMQTDGDAPGGVPDFVVSQTPSNRPIWLACQVQTMLADITGMSVPHLVGRLSVDGNNSNVAITVGRFYYKVYYSLKEQTQSEIIESPAKTVSA